MDFRTLTPAEQRAWMAAVAKQLREHPVEPDEAHRGHGCSRDPDHARARAGAEMATRVREERAAGRSRFRDGPHALEWFFHTSGAWASPPGLPIDRQAEGSGSPSRGLDAPNRVAYAGVAYAIKVAEADDRERHPERPATPEGQRSELYRWLGEHFGYGRQYAWIAEEAGRGQAEVTERVERALRVVVKRLRDRGLIGRRAREEG